MTEPAKRVGVALCLVVLLNKKRTTGNGHNCFQKVCYIEGMKNRESQVREQSSQKRERTPLQIEK